MMGLLALIPSRDWFYGALIVALGFLLVYERHEGAKHELAALQAQSAKLIAQTAAQTAELKAKADMAERAYDKEIAALSNLPPAGSVRLCNPASGALVPAAGRAHAGNAPASAAPGSLQPVPSGNPGSGPGAAGPDIGNLLSALAARADEVSATLREYQGR